MTRQYEVVYIFDSALEETAINERLERFNSLIQQQGAEPPQISHWGKRTLSYEIKKRDTGHYVVATFVAEAAALPEFERALKLDDGVVRYLITLHEHELGAPPMTEEQLAARKRDDDDDDEEE